jgi:UDP-perosamine 4-acetyltransferase
MALAQASSKVIGLEAGGHAKVLIETLQAMGAVEITGLPDADPELWKSKQLGIIVLGSDELLPKLFVDGIRQVFNGVGRTGESNLRRHLFARAQHLGFVVIPCIHPSAVISPSATFGEGPNVMAGAVVNSAARIGTNVRQCTHIGRNSVAGAGAAVVSDVPDDTIVVGVPARPLGKAKA